MASIRWVRPALTTPASVGRAPAEDVGQVAQGGDQVGGHRRHRGQVDRRREDVVRRLGRVDVVVGVHRAGPAARWPGPAITSLAFMLDDVPEPVWKTSTGKWASQCAGRHLRRGVGDGGGHVRLEDAEAAVDLGRRPLDPARGPRSAPGRCPARRWGSSPPPAGWRRPSGRRRAPPPRPSSRVPDGRPWWAMGIVAPSVVEG